MHQLRSRPSSQLSLLPQACGTACRTAHTCERIATGLRLSSQLSAATRNRPSPLPPSPRQPLLSFTVVSLNCAGSLNHLHSFSMIDNPPDIVLVQEPQTRSNSTFRVPGYTLFPSQDPPSENRKPYACIYVSLPIATPRPDPTAPLVHLYLLMLQPSPKQPKLPSRLRHPVRHSRRPLTPDGRLQSPQPDRDSFRAFTYDELQLSAPLVDQASIVSPVGTHLTSPTTPQSLALLLPPLHTSPRV